MSGQGFHKSRSYLGPSLGWVETQILPERRINAGGGPPIQVQPGDQVILTEVGLATTFLLPDVKAWQAQNATMPATGWGRGLLFKDYGGNARDVHITLVPFDDQTIDGLNQSIIISQDYEVIILHPLVDGTGWYAVIHTFDTGTGGTTSINPTAPIIGNVTGDIMNVGINLDTSKFEVVAGKLDFEVCNPGFVLGNPTVGTTNPTFTSLSSILDRAIGSTQGQLMFRDNAGWTFLNPGTNGQFLSTGGPGSNPNWQTVTQGNVSNSGTPVANQLAQWTDATHIKGLTIGSTLTTAGNQLNAVATGTITSTGSIVPGSVAEWVNSTTIKSSAIAYQPQDSDLTALSNLGGTNTIYYRSGIGVWSSGSIGANMDFTGGVLSSTGGGGGGGGDVFKAGNNIFTGENYFTSQPLVVGASTQGDPSTTLGLQVVNTESLIAKYSNDALGMVLRFRKSRSPTIGVNVLLQNQDTIGTIQFNGADGTQYVTGAIIQAFIDGTAGAGNMPTAILIATAPGGGSSPGARFWISPIGHVSHGQKWTADPNSAVDSVASFANPITSNAGARISVFEWGGGAGNGVGGMFFRKSRGGGNPGTQGAVVAGDGHQLNFGASDGTSFLGYATINAYVEGSVASGSINGTLVFNTRQLTGTPIQRMLINSAGIVVIGSLQPLGNASGGGLLQIQSGAACIDGTNGAQAAITITNFQAAFGGPFLNLRHSRGALGAFGLVLQNDPLGSIRFQGSLGGAYDSSPAAIGAAVENSPLAGDTTIDHRISFILNKAGQGYFEKVRIFASGCLCVDNAGGMGDQGMGTVAAQQFFCRQLRGDNSSSGFTLTNLGNDANGFIFLGGTVNPNSPRSLVLAHNYPGVGIKMYYTADFVTPLASFNQGVYGGCQLQGTTAGDNAAAGFIGEYPTAVTFNSVSLSGGATGNLGSISLTAGDWDVLVQGYAFTAGATPINASAGLNTTSGLMPVTDGSFTRMTLAANGTAPVSVRFRFSLASTQSVFAIGQNLTASTTLSFTGGIFARRRR